MKCLICGKSNEKSVCSNCESKKRCKECNILKTDFYKYKNDKLYSTCIECFNKKVICEFCNKEFNKTYLSKHLKRCIINHDNNNYTNNEIINHNENHDNNNYYIYTTLYGKKSIIILLSIAPQILSVVPANFR